MEISDYLDQVRNRVTGLLHYVWQTLLQGYCNHSNFQKDGEEDEDEEEDGEKDEEEDKDNVTNNNANYAAKENYSENNCDHSNDFVKVTYINRL